MGFLGISKPSFMKNAAEQFEEQIAAQMGKKGEVYRQPAKNRKLPNIFSILYPNTPAPGLLTACTFGVSFGDQAVWGNEKIELMLQIHSADDRWGHVLAFLGNHLRENCPFHIGQIIHFGQNVVDDCPMTEFLVIPVDPHTGISTPVVHVNRKNTVKLVRLVPIYKSEIAVIQSKDWKHFIAQLGVNMTDTRRSSIAI